MADLPPVKIQLVAEGIDAIKNAFQSIEASAKKMEEALTRLQKQGAIKRGNEAKKEAQDRTRVQEAESRKREQAKEREYNKLVNQANKWAREELNIEKRKNQQLEAEARRSANARERFFNRIASKTSSILRRGVGTAIGLAGTVAGLGGGYGIADAVGQSLANQKTARQVALQSYNRSTGQYAATPEQVYGAAQGLASTTGFTTQESVAAIKGFGETGGYENYAKMMEILPKLGDVAMATGADFAQLSKSAGLIFAGDTQQSADQLLEKLRMLAEMGRNGAVDLEDMATSLNVLTASAAQFGGDKMKNIATMGAFAQLARTKGTASSSAEALESAKHLSSDIAKNANKFAALGIQVKDQKTGELTDPRLTVLRAIAATGGDATKLHKLFEERSFKGVQGVARIFQEQRAIGLKAGLSDKEASQKGLDAANKALNEFTDANLTAARTQKEADEMRKDPSIRLNQAFDQLRNAVGDQLVPELIKLIPKITELTPQILKLLDAFVKMVNYAAENPIQAIVAALAVAVGASAVSAAIGAAFTAVLAPELIVPIVAAGLIAIMAGVEEVRRKGDRAVAQSEAEADVAKLRKYEEQVEKGKKIQEEGGGDLVLQASQQQLDDYKKQLSQKQNDLIEKRKKLLEEAKGALKDPDNVTGHRSDAEIQKDIDKGQAWLDRYSDLQDSHDLKLQLNNERLQKNTDALLDLTKRLHPVVPMPATSGNPPTGNSN